MSQNEGQSANEYTGERFVPLSIYWDKAETMNLNDLCLIRVKYQQIYNKHKGESSKHILNILDHFIKTKQNERIKSRRQSN